MRKLTLGSGLLGAALIFAGFELKAQDDMAVSDGDHVVIESEMDADAENDRHQGWNLWVCQVQSRGWYGWRTFRGESFYFQAGSGEGQEARSVALTIAERKCEYMTGRSCYSYGRDNCGVSRL